MVPYYRSTKPSPKSALTCHALCRYHVERCSNANGVPSFSPGLRGTSYPGFLTNGHPTLKGLHRRRGRGPLTLADYRWSRHTDIWLFCQSFDCQFLGGCTRTPSKSSGIITLSFGLLSRIEHCRLRGPSILGERRLGGSDIADRCATIGGDGDCVEFKRVGTSLNAEDARSPSRGRGERWSARLHSELTTEH
jgi:hypothetical protein